MALLTTTNSKVQEQEVMRTLEIKLELEKSMKRDLMSLFRRMSGAFATLYVAEGRVIDLEESFTIDMVALLRKHYRKTANIFSKNIRSTFTKAVEDFLEWKQESPEIEAPPGERQRVNTVIGASILTVIDNQSRVQADLIIDTSQKILNDGVRNTTNDLIEEGVAPTNNKVAAGVRKDFNERSVARSELISMQEVGMMASESKEIEANVLNESAVVVGGVALAGNLKKSWDATLDSRTREAHVRADQMFKFNPIPVNGKFVVQGERLRFPRDPAGSAGNIINCRCEDNIILQP